MVSELQFREKKFICPVIYSFIFCVYSVSVTSKDRASVYAQMCVWCITIENDTL